MFNLTPEEQKLAILDCAGGPASFNVEMTHQGNSVISCDPIYQFTVDEIEQQIQETYSTVVVQLQENLERYVWETIKSPAHLGTVRMAAMRQFLGDLPMGLQESRYIVAELPILPFAAAQFDLALCSHFLFSYSDQLSADFHLQSILELCRVAKEVRVFPIIKISGEESPWVVRVRQELITQGYQVNIENVSYEFQKGGNKMFRVLPGS